MKDAKWLYLTECALLVGSGVGSLASIASQQLAFTAAPVSLLLLLNLVNRQRLSQDLRDATNTKITQLDQRLSKKLKAIDQQLSVLPHFSDLTSLRKSLQQRQDAEVGQIQRNLAQRLQVMARQEVSHISKEMASLQEQSAQISESIKGVTQYLHHIAPGSRLDNTETAMGQLRSEMVQLQAKLSEIATQHKQATPRALQDEINQIHRRLNSLPQPFDATALKQDVAHLVKVVGDLVSRREMARLMTEVEKIRQQYHSLDDAVATMRSVSIIFRKQLELVSNKVLQAGGELQAVDLSELERQLQEFTARLDSTDDRLGHLSTQLESTPDSARTTPMVTSPQYELVFNLPASDNLTAANAVPQGGNLLQTALETAQSRVIVVFPSPSAMFDPELMPQFQAFLERGGCLEMGWGHLDEVQDAKRSRYIHDRETPSVQKTLLKTVLHQLTQLKRDYPHQLQFKVLGTDENFLVCDDAYGIVGVHPVSIASVAFPEVTVGLRTTNPKVIQGLIDRYRNPVLDQTDGTAYFNRAVTRYALGDKLGTISDYSEVLRIKPDDAAAYNNRALVRYELGDQVGAIADLNQAILSSPQDAVAYCNRGILRLRQGDKLSAIEDFTTAIQVAPDATDAYLQRGLARLKLGNKLGAIEDFTALIGVDSQNGMAYFHRGMSHSEMGDRLNAMRDMKEAARLFLSQNDLTKHQHAIEAMQKLRQKFGQPGVTELRLVREA